MGASNVESDENTKLLYIDANNLYGRAMSQPLPSGDFEKLDISQFTTQEIIECDSEYPVEIGEKFKKLSIVPLSNKEIQSCLHLI